MFLSVNPNQTHFKNIYKRESMDACLFPLLCGYISEMIVLELAAEEQIRTKELMVFFIHSCVRVCLCVESYCGYSKNRVLLQKHNFRLLPRLLEI